MKWKHFPRYWPFVRGIHRSLVNSAHKGQWHGRNFVVFFHLCLNKRLSKQSWGWWLETPSRPLWRHCNTILAIPPKLILNPNLVKTPLWITETHVMSKQGFAGFEFKKNFGRLSYIHITPKIRSRTLTTHCLGCNHSMMVYAYCFPHPHNSYFQIS